MAHVVSECSKLAQTEYQGRHDNVARYIIGNCVVNADWKESVTGTNRSLREWLKAKTPKYCGISQSIETGKSRQEDQTLSLLIRRRESLS